MANTSFPGAEYRDIVSGAVEIMQFLSKKSLDRAGESWYNNHAKQRRPIASASPPATGKEVNSVVTRLPVWAVCCCADAGSVSAFCDFRTEVFRPLVSKCMN